MQISECATEVKTMAVTRTHFTSVDIVHVPYRGLAASLSDLLGGQVQVTFASVPSSIAYIKAGRLRALAITSATRSEALPDLPTVGELVPGCHQQTTSVT